MLHCDNWSASRANQDVLNLLNGRHKVRAKGADGRNPKPGVSLSVIRSAEDAMIHAAFGCWLKFFEKLQALRARPRKLKPSEDYARSQTLYSRG